MSRSVQASLHGQHSVTVQIPFLNSKQAQIVYKVLDVDKEAKGEIKRKMRIADGYDAVLEM